MKLSVTKYRRQKCKKFNFFKRITSRNIYDWFIKSSKKITNQYLYQHLNMNFNTQKSGKAKPKVYFIFHYTAVFSITRRKIEWGSKQNIKALKSIKKKKMLCLLMHLYVINSKNSLRRWNGKYFRPPVFELLVRKYFKSRPELHSPYLI